MNAGSLPAWLGGIFDGRGLLEAGERPVVPCAYRSQLHTESLEPTRQVASSSWGPQQCHEICNPTRSAALPWCFPLGSLPWIFSHVFRHLMQFYWVHTCARHTAGNQRGNTPALMDEQIVSKQTNEVVILAVSYVMKHINRGMGENK